MITTTQESAIHSTIRKSSPSSTAAVVEKSQNLDFLEVVEEMDCINVNFYLKMKMNDKTSEIQIRIAFGIIYGAIFVFGLLGNGGVIAAVAKNRKLQNARNIFLLSLMASDLLLCFTAVPITPFAAIKKEWIFGHFLCKLVPLSQSTSVLITSWTLTAIALDKYIHIRHVTRGPIKLSRALLIIFCIWVLSCSVNVPYMLSYSVIDGSFYGPPFNYTDKHFCGVFCDEMFWTSDAHRMIYGTSIMALQFVFPLIIISFCYIQILAIVGRDMIVENAHFSQSLSAPQRLEAERRKRRVNYILIAMVATFISAWFPLNLVNILRDFAGLPEFILEQRYLWALVVHSVAMTTVCWNPVLFFWLTRKRKAPRAKCSLMDSSVQLVRPLNYILDRIRRVCAAPDDSSLMTPKMDVKLCNFDNLGCSQKLVARVPPWRHREDPASSVETRGDTWSPKWEFVKFKSGKSWSFHFEQENGFLHSRTARSASVEPSASNGNRVLPICEEAFPLISMNGYVNNFAEKFSRIDPGNVQQNSVTVAAVVEKNLEHQQNKREKKNQSSRRNNDFLLKSSEGKSDGFAGKNDALVFFRVEKSSTV